jgi:flagellar M-ring protein FliF
VNTFIETLRNLGPVRLAMMAGVAALILAFFVYFAGRVSQPENELLYAELTPADSGKIVTELEARNVPYELSSDGSRILVPADQVARLRLAMAEQGLPDGGSLGYEIFDRSDGFGTSNFVQNINHVRALEGELARTIRAFDNVKQARVHLVLPQRELFSRERNDPSASIMLTLAGARGLSPTQVRAIQQLVAAGVPRMQPARVAIVDDKGNLLARTRDSNDELSVVASADERRIALENRLARATEELLERSVGIGNARVEVSAQLDYDRVTENAEIYDPDGQVVRSTQLVEESSRDNEAGDQAVTVANNLPEAQLPELNAGGNSSANSRTEETTNFEISKTVRTHVRESGSIARLSIAVLVNGSYIENADGERVYEPRSDEELQRLAALARSAVGYDESRGDNFEIANLQFVNVASDSYTSASDGGILGIQEEDLLRIAELLVLGIVAALVLLLVVKPLVARLLDVSNLPRPALAGGDAGGHPALLPGGMQAGTSLLAASGGDGAPASLPSLGASPESLDSGVDMAQVDGRLRSSAVRKVSEIVEKHPEEAVTILRTWLYQES